MAVMDVCLHCYSSQLVSLNDWPASEDSGPARPRAGRLVIVAGSGKAQGWGWRVHVRTHMRACVGWIV